VDNAEQKGSGDCLKRIPPTGNLFGSIERVVGPERACGERILARSKRVPLFAPTEGTFVLNLSTPLSNRAVWPETLKRALKTKKMKLDL